MLLFMYNCTIQNIKGGAGLSMEILGQHAFCDYNLFYVVLITKNRNMMS